MILLMVKNSKANHRLDGGKNPINNGIKYLSLNMVTFTGFLVAIKIKWCISSDDEQLYLQYRFHVDSWQSKDI